MDDYVSRRRAIEAVERLSARAKALPNPAMTAALGLASEDIAALPALPSAFPSVDELAQIIRMVDGANSLGAGELAERILAALRQ